MMVLEKKPDPKRILITAAIAEAPILIAGVIMFMQTNNIMWILGAMVLGALIMIPAALRVAKAQERDDA
ncbi:MAG: hypothetical protein QNI84_08420 [Henriciella sp.]|nr:hypothetical protein [Henriciella sp.]